MPQEILERMPHNRKSSLFARLKQLLNEADETDPFAATEALEEAAMVFRNEARRVRKQSRRLAIA